jgi:hypothetical protein
MGNRNMLLDSEGACKRVTGFVLVHSVTHCIASLAKSPQFHPKQVLHRVKSNASSSNFSIFSFS